MNETCLPPRNVVRISEDFVEKGLEQARLSISAYSDLECKEFVEEIKGLLKTSPDVRYEDFDNLMDILWKVIADGDEMRTVTIGPNPENKESIRIALLQCSREEEK